MTRLLVVTAVEAERQAVLGGRDGAVGTVEGLQVHRVNVPLGLVDVLTCGVGPVAAAASTSRALHAPYDVVICAGIAGGFAPLTAGDVVVADAVVHADLGAEDGTGFLSMAELGWAAVRLGVDADLSAAMAAQCDATVGAVLSVSTTTGSAATAHRLQAATPDAVAEAMEGIGVCQAAALAGVRFGELRVISNLVGPRDRDGWQIETALNALSAAFAGLLESQLIPVAG